MTKEIQKIAKNLPKVPGIYKMIDREGEIIYIGKAKDLRKRVISYFTNGNQSPKNQKMIEKIADIDYVAVDSELEAIMLETNLIKKHRPKYNILMKDDKNFVYIKIHLKEDFPKISIVRNIIKDGAKYIGPKTSGFVAKDTLKLLKKILPYRHCPLNIEYLGEGGEANSFKVKVSGNFKYPCLDYHIKRCPAPCIGKCSKEQYDENIKQIIAFLEGRSDFLFKIIKEKMMDAAQSKKFEAAAKLRDKMALIEKLLEKQKITGPIDEDIDVINFAVIKQNIHLVLFQIRTGKLINEIDFKLKTKAEVPDSEEIITRFILNYYEEAADIPKNILLPIEPGDKNIMEKWLYDKVQYKIEIKIPQKGKKNKILDLAYKNALIKAEKDSDLLETKDDREVTKALETLKDVLKLIKIPNRLECYDISHLSGELTVGSMVVFKKGYPAKSDYRMFKIKTLPEKGIDDYKSLREILDRRLRWLSKNKTPKGVSIRKASNMDLKQVVELMKKEKVDCGDLEKSENIVAKKDKKIIGFARLKKYDDKTVEVAGLWVDIAFRGQKIGYSLMQNLLNKTKVRRIYAMTNNKMASYYEAFGFSGILKVPEELAAKYRACIKAFNGDVCALVYDKNKYIEDKSFGQKPDLIVVDGGKGQLSSVKKILSQHHLEIPVISLAKKEEEIFIPNSKNPLRIEASSPESFLIQRLRDEAHRFAIEFNRNLRSKRMTRSSLDDIKGIGAKLRKKLLTTFGSVSNIRQASVKEISKIVGDKMALKIKSKLL